jgi:atypical dual specificity phosphatase
MPAPESFSWVEKPYVAGMAHPEALADLQWLREQDIQLIISLCEEPPRRDWINEAGLFGMHVPVEDMHPPSQAQLDVCLSAIAKANAKGMGAVVHCGAGLGRTGVVLACYLVSKGMTVQHAMARVRRLRPGSIETQEQEEAILEFARRHRASEQR